MADIPKANAIHIELVCFCKSEIAVLWGNLFIISNDFNRLFEYFQSLIQHIRYVAPGGVFLNICSAILLYVSIQSCSSLVTLKTHLTLSYFASPNPVILLELKDINCCLRARSVVIGVVHSELNYVLYHPPSTWVWVNDFKGLQFFYKMWY